MTFLNSFFLFSVSVSIILVSIFLSQFLNALIFSSKLLTPISYPVILIFVLWPLIIVVIMIMIIHSDNNNG